MALLKKSEVLLMQEDVLVHGFKAVGLPYFQDDDLVDARRLFTPSVGEAVLRFRNANERAYVALVRKQTVDRLLEPSSRRIGDFARAQVDSIFANREENFMRFFRYLAFILDLAVFAYRYKKVHLMNPVFVECGNMFDAFLSAEEGLPFWRNFMALCDVVLRNSPQSGCPVRHFRNPALYWNPRDPSFDPDDPAAGWILPTLRLHPDHPILKPDRHAYMKKFWNDVKSSEGGAVNTDEGDEYLNLGVETLNLSGENSNLAVQRSGADSSNLVVDPYYFGAEGSNLAVQRPGADSSNIVVDASYFGAEGSNLVVQRSGADSSNLVVDPSYFGAEGSNLAVQRSGADSSNLGVQGSCLGADSSNLVVQRSNLGAKDSNPVLENSNTGAENLKCDSATSRRGAENSSTPTAVENLNVVAANTSRNDENSNPGAVSSTIDAENLNLGDTNSNSTNENLQPGAENVDTGALNPDPHPFEVLIAAMQWDIHNIVFNTNPEDPALD